MNPQSPVRLTTLVLLVVAACLSRMSGAVPHPNIVYILADDLGYGDVRCFNPQGKIATPNIDRMAAEGMIFTDAHSSSSVCTPTRYGIITGRYNWRSRLKRGVLLGYTPHLIEDGRLTVPAFLKSHGYATACIGKWHLGMDWPLQNGGRAANDADGWKVDYSKPIAHGPTSIGFDHFYGISASLDMAPYTYIENDRVTVVPTTEKKWIRQGPAAVDFEAIDVLPALTRKAVAYIDDQAPASRSGRPFFLYLPLPAPHTPIVPTAEWQDRSSLNAYADFVMQVDATLGEVLDALARHSMVGNTLVVFTSDNGCSRAADYPTLLSKGHNPSAQFRGIKADIFEGGHRMPFIVRWPARVRAGTTSDQLVCLTDLFATCAEIVGTRLPDSAAEDSVSLLPILEGRATNPIREAVVHHSFNGSFAIRQANWKLALCPDSGGWSAPMPGTTAAEGLPTSQLYDLAHDIGETTNLVRSHPEVVTRLTALLQGYVDAGRSTPGKPQENTTPVDIHFGAHQAARKAKKGD